MNIISVVLDLPSSLDILTLSLAISSSAVAILSGRALQEYFRRHRVEKRVKSALVSYLAGLPLQITNLASVFYGIGTEEFPKWKEPPDPEFMSMIDNFVQTAVNDIARCSPIDTKYYEKNIKDHLLYLPGSLAKKSVSLFVLVYGLNLQYDILAKYVSGTGVLEKGLYPRSSIVAAYLNAHQKHHQVVSDLGDRFRDYITDFVDALLMDKAMPDFQPVIEKYSLLKPSMDRADDEFDKTIAALKSANQLSTSSASSSSSQPIWSSSSVPKPNPPSEGPGSS